MTGITNHAKKGELERFCDSVGGFSGAVCGLTEAASQVIVSFLCCLRSIAAHRDHFVRPLSFHSSVCLSFIHTFLVVTHSYVWQATHAFFGMLPQFSPCIPFNVHVLLVT